jgi:heat shock protein HslJ
MIYHSVLPFKPKQLLLLLLILVCAVGCASIADSQRYRGNYTLGHEVNTFCPEINSQCYWLDSDTGKQVRDQLKQLYQDKSTGLYKPVCVIITGEVDKYSTRTGFAGDTDGLIAITRVHGDCVSSKIVTHGDLQHHRWVLIALDNKPINQKDWPVLPVLDFGERLFVEGGDGCRKFNGFAKLIGEKVDFNEIEFTGSQCGTGHSHRELFSIGGSWRVEIKESQYLILENTESILMFKLDDWR